MKDINYKHYLEQLGFTDPNINQTITPDLDTLKRLQLAHLIQYPFQSVTTILDRPVDLDDEAIYDKLVVRRLGGYCYELNGLFLSLLRHLGYQARIITGIVIINNQLEPRNARTHMAIMVTIDKQNYLVDVGFGGLVPSAPLLFSYQQKDDNADSKDNFNNNPNNNFNHSSADEIQNTADGHYKIIKDKSFENQSKNPIL